MSKPDTVVKCREKFYIQSSLIIAHSLNYSSTVIEIWLNDNFSHK